MRCFWDVKPQHSTQVTIKLNARQTRPDGIKRCKISTILETISKDPIWSVLVRKSRWWEIVRYNNQAIPFTTIIIIIIYVLGSRSRCSYAEVFDGPLGWAMDNAHLLIMLTTHWEITIRWNKMELFDLSFAKMLTSPPINVCIDEMKKVCIPRYFLLSIDAIQFVAKRGGENHFNKMHTSTIYGDNRCQCLPFLSPIDEHWIENLVRDIKQ